ncbi:hypothetical protein D030_3376A, partial [Vibrio parahaemolyticus AQ3810]
MHYQ